MKKRVTLTAVFEYDDEHVEELSDELAEEMARDAISDNPNELEATVETDESDAYRFICAEHGAVETVTAGGYSLGHETPYGGPDELDLEGITFEFTLTDEGVEIDAGTANSYMEKFGDWKPVILDALREEDADVIGHADCGVPTLVLGPDEEEPDWWRDEEES